MRRLFLVLASIVFLLPFTAHAKSWSYSAWSVVADVHADASVTVAETVTYDFSGDFSWVTRDLPKGKGILYRDISVTDESGTTLSGDAVDINNKQTSANIRVNFSAQDEQRTWAFRYTVDNAVGYFADHDELYWNAVPSVRDVPIEAVHVTVHLPRAVAADGLQEKLFIGPSGSTIESTDYTASDDGTMEFNGTGVAVGNDFTVVAGWPKDVVTESVVKPTRTATQQFAYLLLFPLGASPFVLFAFLLRRWRRFGRDPKGRGTIVPQYEPPDKAQPAVMSVLLHEHAETKNIAVTIVDLAVRGYVRIEETHEGLFKKKTYAFEKRKDFATDASLRAYERELLQQLFEDGARVSVADLKGTFYQAVPALKNSMVAATMDAGYFVENPDGVRKRYLAIAGGIAVFLFLLVFANLWLWWFIVPVLLDAMLLRLFGNAMPRRTEKGVASLEWAEGFKLYLHTAERFRIAAMKPETFERFLPYAMVFGVEKEWAEKFKDICTEPPSWYVGGPTGNAFMLVAFTSGFSQAMNTSVASVLASSPSSHSGFGGGGFAGGGGGGGGGGAG